MVRTVLADAEGHASAEHDAREAAAAAENAQADLDAAIRAFSGLADEPAAQERLSELRETRDQARNHAERLGGLRSALTIRVGDDWDRLRTAERRELIRAVVSRAVVGQGRGADRVSVELLGE